MVEVSVDLVFVDGIERNFADFSVSLSIFGDASNSQLATFQDGRLRRISVAQSARSIRQQTTACQPKVITVKENVSALSLA